MYTPACPCVSMYTGTDVDVCVGVDAAVVTMGTGRATAPDITFTGVSGTISSSSLYQWKDVSFFTLAT